MDSRKGSPADYALFDPTVASHPSRPSTGGSHNPRPRHSTCGSPDVSNAANHGRAEITPAVRRVTYKADVRNDSPLPAPPPPKSESSCSVPLPDRAVTKVRSIRVAPASPGPMDTLQVPHSEVIRTGHVVRPIGSAVPMQNGVPRKKVPRLKLVAKRIIIANRLSKTLKDNCQASAQKKEIKKQHLKEFFAETSFHALTYYGSSRSKGSKTFWSAVLIGGTAAMIWSTQILLFNYLFSPSQVNVRVVSSPAMVLPELTLCSAHRVNRSKAFELGLNSTGAIDYLSGFYSSFTGYHLAGNEFEYYRNLVNNSFYQNELLDLLDRWQERYGNNGSLFDDNIGHLLDFMAVSCENGKTFTCSLAGLDLPSCCDYMERFRSFNGPCFRLSFLTNFAQSVGGIRNGLTVEYQPPMDGEFVETIFDHYGSSGLELFLDPFNAGMEMAPIYLAEGWDYSIAISGRSTQLSQTGDSHCADLTYSVGNRIVNDPYPMCVYTCLRDRFVATCGCQPMNNLLPPNPGLSYCSPEDVLSCISANGEELSWSNPTECARSCPCACRQFHHDASVSARKLRPAVRHREGFNNRTIRFSVYYPRIQYTSFKEIESISIFNFISNIGGALGLWTGASMVSIMQVIKFVADLFHDKLSDREIGKKKLKQVEAVKTQLRHSSASANNGRSPLSILSKINGGKLNP